MAVLALFPKGSLLSAYREQDEIACGSVSASSPKIKDSPEGCGRRKGKGKERKRKERKKENIFSVVISQKKKKDTI